MLPLLAQLTLNAMDDHHFTAPPSHESHIRSYGGQIVAQALLAASLTVADGRPCHSLHGYFVRPGSTDTDMQFAVDVVRDGRSFSMRQVAVSQNERHIFSLLASFHVNEPGTEHLAPMPTAPAPESLPTFAERFAGRENRDDVGRWFDRLASFDLRFTGPAALGSGPNDGRSQYWFRFADALPADVRLHQALLAYVSDMFILDPILLLHGRGWTESAVLGASLDHAIWFHHDFDVTQWLFFDQETSVAAHSRGLARSQVWSQDGRLVATVAQEALLRPPYSSKS
jgi:acyl-CoA thioesterase-2